VKPLDTEILLLGLGGNLGGEEQIVERMAKATQAVAEWGTVTSSAVYRTAAIGPPQPDYLNAVLRISLTSASWLPVTLITAVLALESALGRDRQREQRWGPRVIDLDVLLWGPTSGHWLGPPELEVPHPRLSQRRFVLTPLADVVDDSLEIPSTGRSLQQLRDAVAPQVVELTQWRLPG
jgi:2-amino-4-hydroxy-6-hydroxymethyldihydropteridine diphosphokinase